MLRSLHADLVNVFEVFLPQLLLYPKSNRPAQWGGSGAAHAGARGIQRQK